MKKRILSFIAMLLLSGTVFAAPDHIATRETIFDKMEVMEEHFHSASQVYPTLANGVAVICGAGAWALSAAFTQIIPASTIGTDFDFHYLGIEDLSAVDVYEIVLYYGASDIEAGRVRVARTANQDSTTNIPGQTIIIPANSRIRAKCASSSGGDTVTLSLFYHQY